MRTIRTAVVVIAALAVTLLGVTMGSAQEPYPPGASAVLNKSAVAPGDTITCAASGFEAGATVTATLSGEGFTDVTKTATADASGNVTVTFEVPETAVHGSTATCTLTGTDASGDFDRTAVAGFTIDNTLPVTGGEFTRGGALAAGVIILGAAMVLIARRKSGVDVG